MKKKLLLANQYISEKIGATSRGTEYDDDFVKYGNRYEHVSKFISSFQEKVEELIYPNPQAVAKMRIKEGYEKITKSSQPKELKYPQVEGMISAVMMKHGNEIRDSIYGMALIEISEIMNALSDLKERLESDLRISTLDLMQNMKEGSMKEITKARKRLSAKRLELDAIKNKKNVNKTLLIDAQQKYSVASNEAFNLCVQFLDHSEEMLIGQLLGFAEALSNFYKSSSVLAEQMLDSIKGKHEEAKKKTMVELKDVLSIEKNSASTGDVFKPDDPKSSNSAIYVLPAHASSGFFKTPTPEQSTDNSLKFSVKALYDFKAESSDELSFKCGDIITVFYDVDDNWFDGELDGNSGIFPKSFVTKV